VQKIYFITRSWGEKTGGVIVREKQVSYLQKCGYKVIIVTPNYNSDYDIINKNFIKIKFTNNFFFSILERFGIISDYLESWIKSTTNILVKIVSPKDIIFATCGGELACIKIGHLVKKKIECKFIVNYHDPVTFTSLTNLNNQLFGSNFHVNRDKLEKEYIKNSDFIITSSHSNRNNILKKYKIKKNLITLFFGYIKKIKKKKLFKKKKLIKIVYAGSMTSVQNVEMLIEIYKYIKNKQLVMIELISNDIIHIPTEYKKNIILKKMLTYNALIDYISSNCDLGFVSLSNNVFKNCIPSKIYEYINCGIPIVGILPNGEAKNFVTKNGFGICANLENYKIIAKKIDSIIFNQDKINYMRNRIIKMRKLWSFDVQQSSLKKIIFNV
jgi:glycosyltransferase involved in cell wall biosynthesis